jgi:N-methylhydantoinase B/oxoprolinase/acetone carboxylase alpha subunit
VNEGCFEPITVTAPEGTIINCTFPASVGSRTNTGWYIHGAIFGALAQALPDRIQSGNGLMSSIHTYGAEADGRVFNAHLFCGGGRGATSQGDGMGLNMFPSSASNVPVEVFELNSPAIVVAKELMTDSAGAGRHRGSPGQRIVFGKLPSHPHSLNMYFHPNRLTFAPQGIFGGKPGTKTNVIVNGEVLSDTPAAMTNGYVTLADADDRLVVEFPSGAGAGDPSERPADHVKRDVDSGLVSDEAARSEYGG